MTDGPPAWHDDGLVEGELSEQGRRPMAELLPLDWASLEELALSRDAFLVYPLIASEGVSALAAEAGVGKSALVLDVALTLVFGLPNWQGEKIDKPQPRRVLLIDGENPARTIARRILAWLRFHGQDTAEAMEHLGQHLIYARKPEFRLGRQSKDLLAAYGWLDMQLAAAAGSSVGFDVVVLDNLMALSEIGDINHAGEMSMILTECGLLADRHQIPVLLEAHPPKVDANRKLMLKGKRPGKTTLISGSQVAVNWVNSACLLVEGEDKNDRLLGQGKAREGAPMDGVIGLRFEDQDLHIGADGGGHSVAITRMETDDLSGESKMEQLATWLRESGFTSNETAATKSKMTKAAGCPFGQRESIRLVSDPDLRQDRFEAGIMSEQNVGPRGGSPSWRAWWVGDDAPFVPEMEMDDAEDDA